MKLYGYYNDNGEIKTAEVEVKEKVILVPEKDGNSIPFIYRNHIDREAIGTEIGWGNVIFYKQPSFEMAKEKLLDKTRKEYEESKKNYEAKKAILEKLEKQEAEGNVN